MPLPVLPGDTADALARRVLIMEHLLYPRIIEHVAAGRIRLNADNSVSVDGGIELRFGSPEHRDAAIAQLGAGIHVNVHVAEK